MARFEQALETVLSELCRMIARDGEGASRLIEALVTGADSEQDAVRAARAVGESLLFKCAVAGGDPNWGRIVCALGYSGAAVVPETTTVHIGEVCVVRGGTPTGEDAHEPMQADEVVVRIDLGQGESGARVLSCDLTKEYVDINAEYHT
jgi:glutamate N-acetyltransferase/amino-acid N-acetyltransferase